MPAAHFRIRSFAFLLDFILLTAVSMVIIWKFLMPLYHPSAFYEFSQWMDALVTWFQTGGSAKGEPQPLMNQSLTEALRYAQDIQLIIFWIYFAVGEAFFGGSSLGKRICRLRSVSTVTLGAPSIMTGIVRGGLKTMAIFLIFPLSMIATICVVFFNKRRQMGHDLLSRTAVVDERYIHLEK